MIICSRDRFEFCASSWKVVGYSPSPFIGVEIRWDEVLKKGLKPRDFILLWTLHLLYWPVLAASIFIGCPSLPAINFLESWKRTTIFCNLLLILFQLDFFLLNGTWWCCIYRRFNSLLFNLEFRPIITIRYCVLRHHSSQSMHRNHVGCGRVAAY